MTTQERNELEIASLNHKLFNEMMDKRIVIPKLGSLNAIKSWVDSWTDPAVCTYEPTSLPDCIVELQNLIKSLKKPKLDC